MNYSLNVKSSSIVHTLLSNCVKLLGKVQKLLIKCISYSVISKRMRVVSPKFYTARKNFTGPPVPTVPTNFKSASNTHSHLTPDELDHIFTSPVFQVWIVYEEQWSQWLHWLVLMWLYDYRGNSTVSMWLHIYRLEVCQIHRNGAIWYVPCHYNRQGHCFVCCNPPG